MAKKSTKAPVKKIDATTKQATAHKKSVPIKKKTTAKRGAAKKVIFEKTALAVWLMFFF